ncbi:MAG TPA: VWA domain-containing protein [Thermoguttaceae bacterium]|nr:VWA domain-containing protein [Thermoguttaceae bacterium]
MMNFRTQYSRNGCSGRNRREARNRKGVIIVLASLLMIFMLGLLAFSIDLGYMMSVQGEMDRAVDCSALAGAGALVDGADEARLASLDVLLYNSVGSQGISEQDSRQAKLYQWLDKHPNDFETEVGHWNPATRTFAQNDVLPSAIHVMASYEHPSTFFARIFGIDSFRVTSEATARYQPRDIALVLDFSGSMNDDSELSYINETKRPGSRAAVLGGLQQMYQELGSPAYGSMQFTPVYISSTNATTIKNTLGLRYKVGKKWVEIPYPYADGSWDDYFSYVQNSSVVSSAGYYKKYGYLTLINYWLEQKPGADQTADLWKVSAQPVTAVKDAVGVFMDYIQEVDCEDKVALVIYNSSSGDAYKELSLTTNLSTVEDTVHHRQAAHYDNYTNIGAGIRKGWEELDAHARVGAKKMIVLMTDGNANRPNGESYGRSYALTQAANAAAKNYQIVTISLGQSADTELMQEIADATNGVHYNIPGGSAVNDYHDDLIAAFRKIADDRPLLLVQ